MANLILTNLCNQRCSYCFAESYLQNDVNPLSFVSVSTFEKYLNFLDRSHNDQVRLLGGEPTLHPSFSMFLKMSLQRGKNILLFSNGLMPKQALDAILEVPDSCIKVLINVTQTSVKAGIDLKKRQYEVIQELGLRAFLGYTLYNLDPGLINPIIDIVQSTKCSPSIRLGVAQPTASGNVSILPKQYRRIGRIVVEFVRKAHNANIQTELDCGFVRCMFSDSELTELNQMKVRLGWHCNPLIDIVSDESAIPCFPLSSEFMVENALDSSEEELMLRFKEKIKHLRIVGVFAECSTCKYRISEGCSGGCLSAAIQRIHKNTFHYSFPEYD